MVKAANHLRAPAPVNAAQRLRRTPDGRLSRALAEPAHPGNQTLLRQLSHSAQVVRRDPPADAKKTAPPAPASPAPGPAPSPTPDAAKTDEVKLTIPWDEILKGNTTLMQVLMPGLQPPAPAAGGVAPAPGAGGAAPAPGAGGASPAPKGPVATDPAPPPVAPLPAPAGPTPDAPSRLALKDFGNLSLGLRLGFPDLKTDPDPNAPPSALQQAIQTGEIINYDMTGKLPTAYQIDKGKLVGACWGLFSKYVAPDFAAKIAKGMSGKSAGGGISYELDGVLLPDFSGGGVSFTLKFGGSSKKRAPAPGPVQPKLKVGSTTDPLEAEADRAADQVMRTPDSAAGTLQRKCAACADEDTKVHTKNNGHAEAEGNAPPIVSQALGSPGQALDAKTRSFFEQRFDADFSQVRLHSDSLAAQSADAVHARAYATGNHIVLGAGESASPSRLLAHELAHVVQQQGTGAANARRQSPAPQPVAHEGNQAALRRLSRSPSRIQPQLAIGAVSDPLNADGSARRVMRTHDSALESPGSGRPQNSPRARGGSESGIGPEARDSGISTARGGLHSVYEVLDQPGRPLDRSTRAFFEPRFGQDLSHVRIHNDRKAAESARAVDALAFTSGNNIVFGSGSYRPDRADGRFILAHELAHTMQPGRQHTIRRIIRSSPNAPLDSYLNGRHISGFTSAGGAYSITRGTKATFAEQEVLLDMLASGRLFELIGDSGPDAEKSLTDQVRARLGIVTFASQKAYKFASVDGFKMNPKYWWVDQSTMKYGPKPGVDKQEAWDDLIKSPNEYAIGCFAATDITQAGGAKTGSFRNQPTSDEADWVPGDAGYVANPKHPTGWDPGTLGENIIYVGSGQFWGHLSDDLTYRTLDEWKTKVATWNKSSVVLSKRDGPMTGLQ
jgi:Domain of unknown function (DUF4157)/Protein-glutamine gamma-glutamyltransferase